LELLLRYSITRFLKQFASFVIFTILIFNSLYSQEHKFVVYGKLKIEKGNTDRAHIIVEKNGNQVEKLNIDRSGKFEFELDYNSQYILTFKKPDYVTKSISINTTLPSNYEIVENFIPFAFEVSLFHQLEGVNTIVFNQPVGKIKYSATLDDFDYDTDYTRSIIKQIEEVERQMAEREKEVDELVKNEQGNQSNNQVEDQAAKIARLKEEAEARKKAEEEQQRLDAEKKAALIAQLKAEAEARKKAEEEARLREQARKDSIAMADAEKRRLAEEARAKAKAEAEAARLQKIQDEQERLRQEEEARARAKAEAEAAKLEQIRKEQEAAALAEAERIKAEQEAKLAMIQSLQQQAERNKQEEEARARAEAEAKQALIDQIQKDAEKLRLEEEARARAEAEAKAADQERRRKEAEKLRSQKAEQEALARARAKTAMEESFEIKTDLTPQKYTREKTVETINLNNRDITRVVVNKNNEINAYLEVKYHWGGTYYFEEDVQHNIRNISEAYFLTQTK